jgi:hypothetical protein
VKPQDRPKFLEIIVGFAELKGKQLSAPAMELFWNAMQAWSIEDFSAAANELIRKCEFMPTPKDFEDLRKAGRKTPGEAWAEVLEYVRGGAYHQWDCGRPTFNVDHPRMTDELILAAVRAIGGFDVIAMSKTDQTPFLERRFAEHYESISDAEDVREALPQIAGPATLNRLTTDGPKLLRDLS